MRQQRHNSHQVIPSQDNKDLEILAENELNPNFDSSRQSENEVELREEDDDFDIN